ncbi:hypothetical protein [Rhizobium sp. 18065]|uniref:hypothetical protein n=1 Tax=Rhizobium sp. 18065 TaxID=2681411 RepID=UPI00135BD5E5|nr:hypothetical protein [Rhizobium sp. 18065]
MTNIRLRGFDSPAQMREYLEEVDDADRAVDSRQEETAMVGAVKELRAQIEGLRRQLEDVPRQEPETTKRGSGWLRIVATITISIALGRIVGRV